MIKTLMLEEAEIEISGLDGQHAHIKNSGSSSVYISKNPGITPGGNDVLRVFGGESATLYNIEGTIYAYGPFNEILVYSNNEVKRPF